MQQLKTSIADCIVKHVTVGAFSSVEQLRHENAGLRQFEAQRALMMGIEIGERMTVVDAGEGLTRVERQIPTPLSELGHQIRKQYLNLGVYSSALIICAAAEALDRTIVVWVPHPRDRTALTVLRTFSIHGGDLGIHAPRHSRENAREVLHLRFYKSGDESNPNHEEWGAGRSGHFELLRPPVNGWATHFDGQGPNIDRFTPLRGPGNTKRGAKERPGSPGPAGVQGRGGRMRDSRTKVNADKGFGTESGGGTGNGNADAVKRKEAKAKRAQVGGQFNVPSASAWWIQGF